jgi:arsenate reductase (glutaredoxin)
LAKRGISGTWQGPTVMGISSTRQFTARSMTITVYGIPNCDTVKKARVWLDGKGIAYSFHDYKKSGADAAKLAVWRETQGWEAVLNRAGTTFKKLPENNRTGLTQAKAIALVLAQPSMIKRPVVEHGQSLLIGFQLEQ